MTVRGCDRGFEGAVRGMLGGCDECDEAERGLRRV